MMSIRRTRADARFHVELDDRGDSGIRDRLSGELHPCAGVGDAHIDAAYLNEQDERGNSDEVRRHLESVAELYRMPALSTVPPPPVDPDAVHAAVAEWTDALTLQADGDAARQRIVALRTLRRELADAETGVNLARARIGEASHRLYADPVAAQRALADTSLIVPLAALTDMVQTTPSLFGVTVNSSSAERFGPASAAAELSERATALAFAVAAYDAAGNSLNTLRSTAASALGLSPEITAEELARTLDHQISAVAPAVDPHHSVARATDRMRALLALADQKTRDAVLERVPGAAPFAREAHAPIAPQPIDRTL